MAERTTVWWSERWLQAFVGAGLEPALEAGEDYLRKRRSLDFLITPSLVTARLFDDERRPVRVKIRVEPLGEAEWENLLRLLSADALLLARLLAGDAHPELEERCAEQQVPLFPGSAQLELQVEGAAKTSQFTAAAALACLEALERDPFMLFVLRGLAREQFLYRLREQRTLQHGIPGAVNAEPAVPSGVGVAPAWRGSRSASYWALTGTIDELSYRIRADELPAALLRRLDTLPLGGLTADLERPLEEAYARIATRAQAFGLGL